MRILCNYFAFVPGRKYFGETIMAFQATRKHENWSGETPNLPFMEASFRSRTGVPPVRNNLFSE
jgi:hypothetical protein